MALTSRDETDLLLPLFEGADAGARFTTFLQRLRRRSGSNYAALIMRSDLGEEHDFHAGMDVRRLANERCLDGLHLMDPLRQDSLRLGRVYGAQEFDAHDPGLKAASALAMRELDLADGRIVRVLHDGMASAWLVIASAHLCSASDSALLSSLLPYVAAAVRGFLLEQQRQLATSLDEAGLHHAGSGWIAFDRAGRVLAVAPTTARAIESATGHEPGTGQRLRELGPVVERELVEAAAEFAVRPHAPERTLVLLEKPRIEAVLARLDHHGSTSAVMVARCRHPRPDGAARPDHFARLHALSRREAQLALLLADGRSLAEAGQVLGLTIETTRNYSKRLFAKVGVRGQAELVRAVYESCAMLA
jgi:DNA-binding CsgD family transcriptional regulator